MVGRMIHNNIQAPVAAQGTFYHSKFDSFVVLPERKGRQMLVMAHHSGRLMAVNTSLTE
jgi:hypothetical protein